MKDPIFISTHSLQDDDLFGSLERLVGLGYRNLELSGGSNFQEDLSRRLLAFKERHGVSLACHNYFPPPKEHFVLNLASLIDPVFEKSLRLCKQALTLSKMLGSRRYGVHAGFLLDVRIDELGKAIRNDAFFDRDRALERFCGAVRELQSFEPGVELYIENNVLSELNLRTFGGKNPLLLATKDDVFELRKELEFKLLLDVAHLKVSARSLGLSFEEELEALFYSTDYLHLSDNDGTADQNRPIEEGSDLWRRLSAADWTGKTATLEVYDAPEKIRSSFDLLSGLMGGG